MGSPLMLRPISILICTGLLAAASTRGSRLHAGRQFVSQREAAEWLGVSVATVRRYVSRGELRGYRLPTSRLIFLRLSDLERFVSSGEIPTRQSRT
jgi:excisionase family DNA binding protein